MNRRAVLILIAALALATARAAEPDKSILKDKNDKASYAIGLQIGRSWKNQEVEGLNPDLVAVGIRDALGGKPLLNEQEVRETMTALNSELAAKRNERLKAEADQNRQAGAAFLAENKKKEGVVALPSGLQYKVAVTGDGPKPSSNDMVRVHYRGTLIDGTEFDSSYKKGEALKFAVTGVIKGWTEALLSMPVGSKWQLFIPSELAYGEQRRPSIPPGSTLLFDVELLAIESKAPAAPPSGNPAQATPPK
jgi:FKBP-type peptidyl-prolyl cis-trans isomerase FklB